MPAGFGNSAPNSPNNIAVSSTVAEFGWRSRNADLQDIFSVNLQPDGTITHINNRALVGTGWSNYVITLTSPAFAAATGVTVLTDTFAGTATVPPPSLSGNTLAISFPQTANVPVKTYTYRIQLVSLALQFSVVLLQ